MHNQHYEDEKIGALALPQVPRANLPCQTPIVHPITAFTTETNTNTIQSHYPSNTAGLVAVSTPAGLSNNSLPAAGQHMVSDESFETSFFPFNDSTSSSTTLFEPTPLPSSSGAALSRESTSSDLADDTTGMDDLREELEMLGEMEVDDEGDEDDEEGERQMQSEYMPSHAMLPTQLDQGFAQMEQGYPRQQQEYPQQQQAGSSMDAQESQRLAELAEKLGYANVKMFIGAFR